MAADIAHQKLCILYQHPIATLQQQFLSFLVFSLIGRVCQENSRKKRNQIQQQQKKTMMMKYDHHPSSRDIRTQKKFKDKIVNLSGWVDGGSMRLRYAATHIPLQKVQRKQKEELQKSPKNVSGTKQAYVMCAHALILKHID